jgi:replication factor C subunit 2/4
MPKTKKTNLISNEIENINIINGIYVPWTEKYRPQMLEDLVADDNIILKINKIIKDREMPNIIITGVPGVGKTSTILCIAKNILGKHLDYGLLESNASDERGIKSLESVSYFCKKKIDFEDEGDLIYAKHKIVLLDEIDNMTEKAQRLVNDLMESYHHNTRFAFTCNSSSKIIESIQSRCIILRYKRLLNSQIETKLTYIANRENVKYTKEGMNTLISISQGDLRQAVSSLQVMSVNFNEITPSNVFKVYDKPGLITIIGIFNNILAKNFVAALKCINDLKIKGYSSADIAFDMLYILKKNGFITIPEDLRIKYIKKISKTYFYINQGIDTTLQLTGCVAKLCL